jgi:hypothetical protein
VIAQAAEQQTGAEHEQGVGDNRAGNRRFHEHVLASVQRSDRNDQLRQISQRRIEKAADSIAGLGGNRFGCVAKQGGQRHDGEYRKHHRHGLFTFDLSCPSPLHFAYAQQLEDGQNRNLLLLSTMTVSRDAIAQAAMQYLIWAIEDIKKGGNQKAAKHARIALKALRGQHPGSADKTDEHAT